jgi:MinD superfamily P-loop ATPase
MRQLLVLSGKGGTGKTTIASALIKISKAKAFADCDIDAPNLHLVLKQTTEAIKKDYYGLPKAEISQDLCKKCGLCMRTCRFDSVKLVNGKYLVDYYACEGCGVCEYVCPVGAVKLKPAKAGDIELYKNDHVFSTAKLKMGSGTSGLLVSEVKKQLKENAKETEFVIIDGSPGIGCPVIASISGVDIVLVVAEPSVSGISDMERNIQTASKFQTKSLVCVNKFNVNINKTKEIKEFCVKNTIPYIGEIPFDKEAIKAVNNGRTIADVDCESGKEVKKIYETIKKYLEV